MAYTPEQKRAWMAERLAAERARGLYKGAGLARVNAAIEANRKASRLQPPKQGHNSRRGRTLVIDRDSSAFSDIRWRQGVAYYTFTNGYSYADAMDKSDFIDWAQSPSLGKWWNEEWK